MILYSQNEYVNFHGPELRMQSHFEGQGHNSLWFKWVYGEYCPVDLYVIKQILKWPSVGKVKKSSLEHSWNNNSLGEHCITLVMSLAHTNCKMRNCDSRTLASEQLKRKLVIQGNFTWKILTEHLLNVERYNSSPLTCIMNLQGEYWHDFPGQESED